MSCMRSCLSPSLPPTQGKNITVDEFEALGDMLGSAKWEMCAPEEYKNDLAQPSFLVNQSASNCQLALLPQQAKPDENGPCTEKQWLKVKAMVA